MRNLARDGKLGSGTAEAGPALDRARPTPYSGRESLKLLVPPQRRSHMGKINWNRVVLGGLLAGGGLNVIDWVVYGKVLAADFNAALQALNKGPMTGSTIDRKSTRLNSSHGYISYAVFFFKKKKKNKCIDTTI